MHRYSQNLNWASGRCKIGSATGIYVTALISFADVRWINWKIDSITCWRSIIINPLIVNGDIRSILRKTCTTASLLVVATSSVPSVAFLTSVESRVTLRVSAFVFGGNVIASLSGFCDRCIKRETYRHDISACCITIRVLVLFLGGTLDISVHRWCDPFFNLANIKCRIEGTS